MDGRRLEATRNQARQQLDTLHVKLETTKALMAHIAKDLAQPTARAGA